MFLFLSNQIGVGNGTPVLERREISEQEAKQKAPQLLEYIQALSQEKDTRPGYSF